MLVDAAIIEENVRFSGENRTLEGILAYSECAATCAALIAGPHPLLGGDMNNNVVDALRKALASQNIVTLSFNYAGVGGSGGGPTDWPAVISEFWKEGTFKGEADWAEDTGSAIMSLLEWCPLPLLLVGYSFGCSSIVKNLSLCAVEAIILISPNPKQGSFEPLADSAAPLLLIHSDNDFACTASETTQWAGSLREPKKRVQLAAGEHFFRGHEQAVAGTVFAFLRQYDILRMH